MGKQIITISRELGAAGHSVGKQVADRLGFTYCDQELVVSMAKETGLSLELLEKWWEYFPVDDEELEDYLWNTQKRVMLQLAQEGPCVIVGRCGDLVFPNRPDTLNVFVYAPMEARIQQYQRQYGGEEAEIQEMLRQNDQRRYTYHKKYSCKHSDSQWGSRQTYHLCLNSAYLGLAQTARIIADVSLYHIEDSAI